VSEAGYIFSLTQHPGWEVFRKELENISASKLQKLRKCRRDSAFYKLQGNLDQIDDIFRWVETTIEDLKEEHHDRRAR